MNKPGNLLIGPEVVWLIFYILVLLIIRFTNSPIKSMDSFWLNTTYIIPMVLIPLTFMIYFIPGSIHKWMLLRIWIVGIIGGHYVLNRSLESHSEGGPGVGTAYMVGIGLVFIMLIVGSIFAFFKFR